ncbi:MAG: DUF4192 domain-containing protein [Actinomycetales bacterium]
MTEIPIVREMGGIVASVPHLLGFHPRNSLVLLLLTAPDEVRGRRRHSGATGRPRQQEDEPRPGRLRFGVHCTIRVDLPERLADVPRMLDELDMWRRQPVPISGALALIYPDAVTADDATAVLDSLLANGLLADRGLEEASSPAALVLQALETHGLGEGAPMPATVAAVALSVREWAYEEGLPLQEVLVVARDTYRSAWCGGGSCCPPGGRPVPSSDDSVLAPEAVLRGEQVLASRETLAASLQPGDTTTRLATAQAVARLAEAPPTRRELLATWHEAVARRAEGSDAWMTDDTAARLLLLVQDLGSRDRVLAHVAVEPVPPAGELLAGLDVLSHLVRLAPDEASRAAAAGVLAFCAYQEGNGALALCALEVSAFADPFHSLSEIVRQALAQGLDPRAMRLSRASRRQVERGFPIDEVVVLPTAAAVPARASDLPAALPSAVPAAFRRRVARPSPWGRDWPEGVAG